MPKPPVPFVSAREMVITFWKDESILGEGKRVCFGKSTFKLGAPRNTSNVLAEAKLFAGIIESEGNGSKLTELRIIDMGASLSGFIVDRASKAMPVKNLEGWHKGIDK
jgi:hypothetical protein